MSFVIPAKNFFFLFNRLKPIYSENIRNLRYCNALEPGKTKTALRWHGGPSVSSDTPTIPITFLNPFPSKIRDKKIGESEENQITVQARIGETFLQTAQRHSIELEGS
mmetsp:Transcript_17578/g.24785  ORF Transcript_17578/g.24785 Transcript_17578/m.24785 type:complete len:108 (-) Transcript_17578:403-726(-)